MEKCTERHNRSVDDEAADQRHGHSGDANDRVVCKHDWQCNATEDQEPCEEAAKVQYGAVIVN